MHRAIRRILFGVFLGTFLGWALRRRRSDYHPRGHFDPDGAGGSRRGWGRHHHQHHHQ